MSWVVVVTIHVVPDDDIIGHELSPTCGCLPGEELTETEDGMPMYHFTHNAWDGRSE